MLGRDKGDRGALVALGLMLVAIVAVTWFGYPADQVIDQVDGQQVAASQQNNISESVSSFDPWRDSYAQWLMAVLSVVATAVSVWAVGLLRDTLKATREATKAAVAANETTRKIGQKQLRAYVSLQDCAISEIVSGKKVTISMTFKNCGATPCRIKASAIGLSFVETPVQTIPNLTPIEKESGSTEGPGQTFIYSIGTRRALNPVDVQMYQSGSHTFVAACEIHYEDIFGEGQITKVAAYRRNDATIDLRQLSILPFGNAAS